MTDQPSTSNPAKKSTKTRNPNWLELPEDVWLMIFSKLKTIDIIDNVEKVCKLFRTLCKQPAMFKTIDMSLPDAHRYLPYDVSCMTRYAVDLSAGALLDISVELLYDDTLMYIVDRSKNLKRLRLEHYIYVSDKCLIEAVKKLPMLEELQLIMCKFLDETVEAVGRACPSLKSFSLHHVGSKLPEFVLYRIGDRAARAIARSMPQLRHLQLMRTCMTNIGLKAILNGCPLLESLDIYACFRIDLLGELGKRCEGIKHVEYPNDAIEFCGGQAEASEEDFHSDRWIDEVAYDSEGI